MVLSGKSCGLEEPFTDDIIEKSDYFVQRKPKLKEKARSVEDIVKERIRQSTMIMSGKPANPNDAESSSKRHKKEEEVSRESLLDQRVKKKNDKFCWF